MANLRICSIPGCGKPRDSRGYCGSHYSRWRRHGDPLAGRTYDGELPAYLTSVVMPYTGNDCLFWPYGRTGSGYAVIGTEHKLVHRIACESLNGAPPTDKHEAAHNCGKGHLGCVNPNHLEWKTKAENSADKIAHGTHNRGERHSMAKLNANDVRLIRSLQGRKSQVEIAAMFGVTNWAIWRIQHRRVWKHVD